MRVLFTTAPLHGHFYPLVPRASAGRAPGHVPGRTERAGWALVTRGESKFESVF